MRLRAVIVALLVMATVCLAGCDRWIDIRTPARSLPGDPPTPVNLTSVLSDRTVTLAWELPGQPAGYRFRVYRALQADDEFIRYDSTSDQSLVLTGLQLGRPTYLRVTSVSSVGVESQPSEALAVTAGLLSIAIENNDPYTTRRDVRVQLKVPVLTALVELSADSTFASGSSPVAYQAVVDFSLSAPDGPKTVYARFTFQDGSESGEVVHDDITLDTKAFIDSVYYSPAGSPLAAGDTILFILVAAGEADGEATVSLDGTPPIGLEDDGAGADAVAGDGIYTVQYIIPHGLTLVAGVVRGKFTDLAGNAAVEVQAAELLDIFTNTRPDPVTLAVSLADSTTARLTWNQSEAADFESYRIYRSDQPGIGDADSNLVIVVESDQNTLRYDDFLLVAGTYYYRIFVFGAEGLFSGSNEVTVTR